MAKKSIQIDLDLQDRDAKRKLQALAREVDDTADSLEDAESAGKAMARAIERAADDMIDEIDATKRAVDELETALGADFDGDVREVVADLKSLGLTAADVEADAEQLAAALRKSGDVNVHATAAGFDDVGQAVGSVREETGRATDTMHGFVGGAVGELPLIGEAMGPVSEGLGQLTEGALAGEIALKDMAKVIGPMAGITAGVMLLNKALESAAETDAFNDEQIESFRDAIDEVGAGVAAVNAVLEETQAITGRAGGIGRFFEGTKDITADLIDAGVTYDEWVTAIESGGEAMDVVNQRLSEHRDRLVESRNEALRNNETTIEFERAIAAADNALEIAAETRDNYADSTQDSAAWEQWHTDSTIAATEATADATDATDDYTDTLDDSVSALREQSDALVEQVDAMDAVADGVYELEEAQWALEDAVVAATEAHEDADATDRDRRSSLIEVARAADALADSEVEQARATARATGEVFDAVAAGDRWNRSMIDSAAALSGPMRRAVLDHIGAVNGIPDGVVTAIETALNQGDIETANRLLDQTSRSRTANINAVADTFWANYALDLAARNRTAYIRTQRIGAHPSSIYNSARGTPYSAGGLTLVGEEGPELVDLPQGAAVTDAQASKGRMARMGNTPNGSRGGAGVVNIVNHWPAGVRPVDVTQANRRWRDVQGPR